MFNVIRKSDNQPFKVYSVKSDKTGYPSFLIYDNAWIWKSAKWFEPYK